VAFNAQWFRVAVDPDTGEIRILRSVHAADAGKVMNPMQCRGQVEGGVAQALGATLFENVRIDEQGAVETAAFRRYRLPQYADVPRTEVHFMETADAIGPLGAKSMSESPFNPVAPAFANALRDATGVRFTELPLTRDRVWLALAESPRTPVHPYRPDPTDVPGPATVLRKHQLRSRTVQRGVVDAHGEQNRGMSEVGVDLGPGQQRVVPVRTADRDEETQPVLAADGVEAGTGGGQDVVEPGSREAVHLGAAGGALEADPDPVQRPVRQVGHGQPGGAGEVPCQVELRERHEPSPPGMWYPDGTPVQTHMRTPEANSAAHAMRQETYALQVRQYHRGTAVAVVPGRDNPFHEPLS
jgi:hypothetical protein